MKPHGQLAVTTAAAAAIFAVIVAISPQTAIVANGVPSEIQGVDILGITLSAANLPEQQFPAQ